MELKCSIHNADTTNKDLYIIKFVDDSNCDNILTEIDSI